MDRALDFESGGSGFESRRRYQLGLAGNLNGGRICDGPASLSKNGVITGTKEVPDTCYRCEAGILEGDKVVVKSRIFDERARQAFGDTVNLPFCPDWVAARAAADFPTED